MNGPFFARREGSGQPGPDGSGVAAFGAVRVSADAFPALRKQPGPAGSGRLSHSLLRQADDQAVAAVAAVFRAVHDFGLPEDSFTDWGVVAAPCRLGRSTAASVLDKYRRLGPRGVSPLGSPYLSLHAVSAMVSVALGAHGPNLGAGGGPGAVADGLLAALTVLLEQAPPGVWLVLTAWDPEPDSGVGPAVCHAVALALTPPAEGRIGLRLRYRPAATVADGAAPPSVPGLVRFLEGRIDGGRSEAWFCPVTGGGGVELTDEAARTAGLAAPWTEANA